METVASPAFYTGRRGRPWFDVTRYGAVGDGSTDSTTAVNAAVTAAQVAGGIVYFPAGTYQCNITITGNGVILRGQGRRLSIIRPQANSDLVTIDSTSGSIHSCGIESLELSNVTSGGFTQKAASNGVTLKGSNINDWHKFENLYIEGFVRGFNIIGRTVWSRWIGVEINVSTQIGFYCVTDQAVNFIQLINVRVGSSQWEGFWLESTGANNFQVWTLIVNAESNGADATRATVAGMRLRNTENFNLIGCYFENNGTASNDGLSAAIFADSTSSRTLVIEGSRLIGSNFGFRCTATSISGKLDNCVINYKGASGYGVQITSTENLQQFGFQLGSDLSLSNAGAGAGDYNLPVDGNGNFPATIGIEGMVPHYSTSSSTALDVRRCSSYNSNVAANYTISTLTNAMAGQVLKFRNQHTTNKVTFAAGLMWNTKAVDILPGDVVEFLVLGYSSTGLLRVVSRNGSGDFSPPGCSADNGDAAKTLNLGVDYTTQVWATALTGNRAVTLNAPAAGTGTGGKFRIIRKASATGASTLDVGAGPLKSLALGQWCDVEYNFQTSAWILAAFGSL